MKKCIKKIRSVILVALTVVFICALSGCGMNNDNETGSNTDDGNNQANTSEYSTGIIDEIVTDAIDGIDQAVTDVENWGDGNNNNVNGNDNNGNMNNNFDDNANNNYNEQTDNGNATR